MKVLVTGGAGFIGSHIAAGLLAQGHRVRVLDNLSSGKRENLASVKVDLEFIEADVRDLARVSAAARGCELVYHEAAIVSVPYSVEKPQETHDTNIQGTLNVLQAARAAGVRRVVFASSAAVYGDEPTLPKSESMLPAPISPYGVEKLTGEHYLRVFDRLFGVETVALRYFNVFGPRQDPSSPYSGVISVFVDRILAGRAPTLFGDGSATRDFVFVDDVVQANLLAAQAPAAAVTGQSFNVACGVQTTLLSLVSILARIVGREVAPLHAPPRDGDIPASVADIARARGRLGYTPRVSVEDGLRALLGCIRSG